MALNVSEAEYSMVFNHSIQYLRNDASKILHIISLFLYCGLCWAEAFVEEYKIDATAYDEFLELFRLTFSPVKYEEE